MDPGVAAHGGDDPEGAVGVGVSGESPAVEVDVSVVDPAQRCELVEVGVTTVGPVGDVVGLALRGGLSHPGMTHPLSRRASAVRWAGVANRVVRPTAKGCSRVAASRWARARPGWNCWGPRGRRGRCSGCPQDPGEVPQHITNRAAASPRVVSGSVWAADRKGNGGAVGCHRSAGRGGGARPGVC